jgi:hypothetical protein
MDEKKDDNLEKCHVCGKVHKMAYTPFPFMGDICPYDISDGKYEARVAMVKQKGENHE